MERRSFLRVIGTSVAGASLGCGDDPPPVPERGRFFDEHEWATIAVATSLVFPSTDGAGAIEARAVAYIDRLLSAFEESPPAIHAGGPTSDRRPFRNEDGTLSSERSENHFAAFLPLSRVQEIGWRMRIEGSASTPGGDFNDAILGPTVGLRTLYREGVAALDARATAIHMRDFVSLDAGQREEILDLVRRSNEAFVRAMEEHTLEGVFAAPEYGGNSALTGWTLSRWDGDSMPAGYAFFDGATSVDDPERPTSIATPGSAPEDFSNDTILLLGFVAPGSGGMRFF